MSNFSKQHRNTLMIQAVASALGELKERVAFVGGATTALYIDDIASPSPTPSDDVDFVVEITSPNQYAEFEKLLREKGFKDPSAEDAAPICRKFLGEIQVDVMPTEERILGFANRWYVDAMKHKEPNVKNYIQLEFSKLLQDEDLLQEAASGFIRSGRDLNKRANKIVERIKKL